MKKILLYIFSITLLSFFTGCGSEKPQNNSGKKDQNTDNVVSEKPEEKKEIKKPAEKKVSFKDLFKKHFVKKDSKTFFSDLDAIINKEKGVYVIFKPGAMAAVKNYKSATELQKMHDFIGSSVENIDCKVKKQKLPTFEFETEEFTSKGCFYEETNNSDAIQKAYNEVKEMLGVEPSEAEWNTIKETDKTTSVIALITEAAIEFRFAKISGKWYLVLIDVAKYDLSA